MAHRSIHTTLIYLELVPDPPRYHVMALPMTCVGKGV